MNLHYNYFYFYYLDYNLINIMSNKAKFINELNKIIYDNYKTYDNFKKDYLSSLNSFSFTPDDSTLLKEYN